MKKRLGSIFKNQYFNMALLPFSAGVFFVLKFPRPLSVAVLFAVSLILIICQIFCGRKIILVFFALGILLSCPVGLRIISEFASAGGISGSVRSAEGVVIYEAEDRLDILSDKLDGEAFHLRFAVRDPEFSLSVGDRISGDFFFSADAHPELIGDGVLSVAIPKEVHIVSHDRFYSFINSVRLWLISAAEKLDSGFAKAILVGDRSGDLGEMKTAMRLTGTSHLLAISGLHTSVLLAVFAFLIERLCPSKKAALIAEVIFAFFFSAVTLFSPSVLRCAFLVFSVSVSRLFRREIKRETAVFFSAAVLIFISPFTVADISFLLSHFAYFAIVHFASPVIDSLNEAKTVFLIQTKRSRFVRLLLNFGHFLLCGVIISISVVFFTVPISLSSFGEVNVFTWLFNLIAVPLFTPVFCLALVFVCCDVLGLGFLLPFIKFLYSAVCRILFAVIRGFSLVSIPSGYVSAQVVFLCVFFFLVYAFIFIKRVRISSLLPIMASSLGVCAAVSFIF